MIIKCPHGCGMFLDDEFRTTVCPHETFPANDGRNNFQHHPDSYLEGHPPKKKEQEDEE